MAELPQIPSQRQELKGKGVSKEERPSNPGPDAGSSFPLRSVSYEAGASWVVLSLPRESLCEEGTTVAPSTSKKLAGRSFVFSMFYVRQVRSKARWVALSLFISPDIVQQWKERPSVPAICNHVESRFSEAPEKIDQTLRVSESVSDYSPFQPAISPNNLNLFTHGESPTRIRDATTYGAPNLSRILRIGCTSTVARPDQAASRQWEPQPGQPQPQRQSLAIKNSSVIARSLA
jgi:hypothetical protein